MKKYIHYRELLWSFAKRDIQARYKGTLLGIFWSVINPLTSFCIYLIVFGFFLKVRMPQSASILDFTLYFSAGYFPWIFFQNTVVRSATSIVDNRNYIKKVAFPSEIFPSTILLSELVSLGISMTLVLIFSVILKGVSWLFLLLPFVIVLQIIFTFACILVVSAITVFFRDVPQLLNSIFMVWFWLTPIMYTVDMVPKKLHLLVYLNPLHHILALYRAILFHGTLFNGWVFALSFLFSGVILYASVCIFRTAKPYFGDLL